MTPKIEGYTTPAPALDLTTSLRGDFSIFTKKMKKDEKTLYLYQYASSGKQHSTLKWHNPLY
jgi:hypothetical protein